jgi:hypothetical protein
MEPDGSRMLGILLNMGLAVTVARCEADWTVRVTVAGTTLAAWQGRRVRR